MLVALRVLGELFFQYVGYDYSDPIAERRVELFCTPLPSID